MKYSPDQRNRIAIIGATSGLGSVVARYLADKKWNLTLVGNSKSRLLQVQNEVSKLDGVNSVHSYQCDLLSEEGVQTAFEACKDCDIAINFVGIGWVGSSVKMSDEEVSRLLRLNVEKTTLLSLRLAKHFAERGYGKLINTASLAGLHPIPYFNVYAASKAYLISFGRGLHREMREKGVDIITLCPGGLRTQFHLKSGLKDEVVQDYKAFITDPIVWARKIDQIVRTGRRPSYILWKELAYAFLVKILPIGFFVSTSGQIYKKYANSQT